MFINIKVLVSAFLLGIGDKVKKKFGKAHAFPFGIF